MHSSIPKKLYHIWVGPKDPPLKWHQTWIDKHPDWEYTLLDNDYMNSRTFKNQHLLDVYWKQQRYEGVADIIRYEVLYEQGGFIPPSDAVCYHNVEELFTEPIAYSVFENEQASPGYFSPIYAAPPGNTFLRLIIEHLGKWKEEDARNNPPWCITGNSMLMQYRFLGGYEESGVEEEELDLKIFPSHYFIPYHFNAPELEYKGTDKIYARQMWGTTLNTYEQGE